MCAGNGKGAYPSSIDIINLELLETQENFCGVSSDFVVMRNFWPLLLIFISCVFDCNFSS